MVVAAGPDGRFICSIPHHWAERAIISALSHRTHSSPDTKFAGNGFWGPRELGRHRHRHPLDLRLALGPAEPAAKLAVTNGDATHGSIVAFRWTSRTASPPWRLAWISPDMLPRLR